MALLMSEGERANREGLSQGLSNYYNSPGMLAVLRRKFESVTRRAGSDPATFATELENLAVRGFGYMGTRARNRMVRDRFITDQCSCGLRHHLDSVPPDTPIREIVDRCWVWESHSEQKMGSSQGTNMYRGHTVVASDSRESTLFMEDLQTRRSLNLTAMAAGPQFRWYLCPNRSSLLADNSSFRMTGSTTPAVPQHPAGFGNTPNPASLLGISVFPLVTTDHPYRLLLSSNFSSLPIQYPTHSASFLTILVTGTNCNG